MRPPGFWQRDGALPRLLAPLSSLVGWLTARRLAQGGWRSPVPVICCGNVTVGGAGKTLVALDLATRLRARGLSVHVLTRGYGGRSRGVLRVDPGRHDASLVGDEALLLAAVAPCWVAADRAASARAAIASGATTLVMDDGLQNPGLVKDVSILVVDAASGFGNGRLLPAGPLRETVAAGAARCRAAAVIGDGVVSLPDGLPVLRASLLPDAGMRALSGQRVLAFAGIGRPEKFFASLASAGASVVRRHAFADHHRFSAGELARLSQRASAAGLALATTPKDAVRLPAALRPSVRVAGVSLGWQDEDAVERLLDDALAGTR